MKHLFHHIVNPNNSIINEPRSNEFKKTITLHPLKKDPLKYQVHNDINLNKINQLRHKYYQLKKESEVIQTILLKNRDSLKEKPRKSIIGADFFDTRSIYSVNDKFPKHGVEYLLMKSLNYSLENLISNLNEKHFPNAELEFVKTLHGYSKYNPLEGLDFQFYNYIRLHTFTGNKRVYPLKQLVRIKRPFTNLFFRDGYSLFLIKNPKILRLALCYEIKQ